jgi:hypothetical protein
MLQPEPKYRSHGIHFCTESKEMYSGVIGLPNTEIFQSHVQYLITILSLHKIPSTKVYQLLRLDFLSTAMASAANAFSLALEDPKEKLMEWRGRDEVECEFRDDIRSGMFRAVEDKELAGVLW